MKLLEIEISNFRAFNHAVIPIGDNNCIVGPNGAGKSTILAALDVFFRVPNNSGGSLKEEDFHLKNVTAPIEIRLMFHELSTEAQTDLKHYFRNDRLVVSAKAVWDPERACAPVTQFGTRLGMSAFRTFFELLSSGAKVPDLKTEYQKLRSEYKDLLQAGSKPAMIEALNTYEAEHADLCTEIPSAAEFYGIGGAGMLRRHVQWIHVPAVKDPAEEGIESKNSWFGQLLERAVRSRVKFDEKLGTIRGDAQEQYRLMLEGQQSELQALSTALTTRMSDWATSGARLTVKWEADPQKSVQIQQPFARLEAGDSSFQGSIERQGHGFQRSYLLALLQELAQGDGSEGPLLLLGCEEPELYQHPPQVRHLANTFDALSKKGWQVLLCTHSPYLVTGKTFQDVRVVGASPEGGSEVRRTTFADISAELQGAGLPAPRNESGMRLRLNQTLHPATNEMFFAPVLVLVEGNEDEAYLLAHLALTGCIDEFRRLGCHIVPAGRKSEIPKLLAVSRALKIPTFVVFDGDSSPVPPTSADDPDAEKKRQIIELHRRDNAAILKLAGADEQPAFPDSTDLWLDNLVQWRTEIGAVLKGEVGEERWNRAADSVRKSEDLLEGDFKKNALFIGFQLEALHADGCVSANLTRLCDAMLAFARASRSSVVGAAEPPATT